MELKFRIKIFTFLTLLLFWSPSFSQKDTIHFYYPALFTGLELGAGLDQATYTYSMYDSLQQENATHEFNLILATHAKAGFSFKSKYFGVFVSIPSMKKWMDNSLVEDGDLKKSPARKTFGITLYPKQFLVKALYSKSSGAIYQDDDTVINGFLATDYAKIKDFSSKIFDLHAIYFFNSKFSFSKMYSFMYFPKKSVFSFSIGTDVFYESFKSDSRSFVPNAMVDSLIDYSVKTYYRWNYTNSTVFRGICIQPGISYFLTANQFKKKRKVQFFHGNTLAIGPSISQGIISSASSEYAQTNIKVGVSLLYAIVEGINFKHGFLQISGLGNTAFHFQNNFRLMRQTAGFTVTAGFRIPFKRPYDWTDKKISVVKNKFKKKDKSTE